MVSLGLSGKSVLKHDLLNPDTPKLIIEIMKLCVCSQRYEHHMLLTISNIISWLPQP
jgi:hypothetical protein